jgi:dTMP kinase
VSEEDPQRTQEWSAPDVAEPGTPAQEGQPAAGSTAERALDAAAAREAAAQAERQAAMARGAELKAELRETEVRKAEEQTAEAHDETEAAQKSEEKLSRKERKARERAQAAEAEAEKARRQANEAARLKSETSSPQPAAPATIAGATVMSPGIGSETDPAAAAAAAGAYREPVAATGDAQSPLERPEVLAGAAFAGAFLLARIFKRLVD